MFIEFNRNLVIPLIHLGFDTLVFNNWSDMMKETTYGRQVSYLTRIIILVLANQSLHLLSMP